MYSGTKGQVPSADDQVSVRQVILFGVPYWQASTGRTFPQVAGAEDPPPAPTPPDPKPPAAGDPSGEEGDEFDKDRALATIRKLRDSEKATKAQLKELDEIKAKLKAHEDAKLSETERLQARLEELEKAKAEHERERQQWRDERALGDAARKLNARNPAVVVKLVDASKLERNADGEPTNAEDLVKALLKEESYLVGAATQTNGVPSTPRSSAPQGHDDRVKDARSKLAATGDYNPL